MDALVTEMIQHMDKPFAFFGRELGSQARLLLRFVLVTGQARSVPCQLGLSVIQECNRTA